MTYVYILTVRVLSSVLMQLKNLLGQQISSIQGQNLLQQAMRMKVVVWSET